MDKAVKQIVIDALRLAGKMNAPGRVASPEELTEGLGFLNQFLDHRSILRNSVYNIQDLTFPLVSGTQTYNIGTGAVSPGFNTPRPIYILKANTIYQTSPSLLRLPIEIIDYDPWGDIRVPQLPAIPLKLWYQAGYTQTGTTGLASITLWPAPDQAYSLEIFVPLALPSALLITDTIFAPPGYAKAIQYGLASEIQLLYPNPDKIRAARVDQIAEESWRWLEVINAPRLEMSIDPMLSGNPQGFNWKYSLG